MAMSRISIAIVVTLCLASPSVAADNGEACLAAGAALLEARSQISSPFVALSRKVTDFRFVLDHVHFTELGDPREGFWTKAPPSGETSKLFLQTPSVSASLTCPGLAEEAHSLGVHTGHHAEHRAKRNGATISLQMPVLNQRGDEALLFVGISYPGGRDATGWVYLIQKNAEGVWAFVDRQLAFVS
jgi:hypothetical protein